MLIEVKRHGFSFWEAPHRIGPAFDEPDPWRVRLNHFLTAFFRNELELRDANGKSAKPIREDVNDQKVWGLLVELADELDPTREEAEPEYQHRIAEIQRRVRGAFGLTWREFMKSDRKEAMWARTASMALCWRFIEGITMEEIAQANGWRKFAAVLRATKQSEALRQTSGRFAAAIGQVEAGLLMQAA